MDVSKKKYVLANIKIPIEIKENNVCEPFMDLLNMEISELQSLPVVNTDPEIQKQLKENLFIFLSKTFPESNQINNDMNKEKDNELTMSMPMPMVVKKEELKKKSQPINTSFKTYNKKSCKKYTVKNYDNSGR